MNETISKWLGECPHDPPICDICCGDCPDYENDESAWTQELYDKIERNPIAGAFIMELQDEVMLDSPYNIETVSMPWLFLRSRPDQKAAALSRAITEQEETS